MRKVVSFDTRSLWRYFDLQLCRYVVHRKVESKISCIEVNFNYILYIYIYIYILKIILKIAELDCCQIIILTIDMYHLHTLIHMSCVYP